jgi:peptide/nickel transport system permease protein
MLAFILRRVVVAFTLLLIITYIVWLLTTDDGALLLTQPTAQRLLPLAFGQFLQHVLRGDLGESLRTGEPVLAGIRDRVLASALVIVPAFILQELGSVVLGLLAATRFRSLVDRAAMIVVTVFAAMPPFWLGLALLILFAQNLHWFPFGDLVSLRLVAASFNTPQYWDFFRAHPWQGITDLAWHLALPVATLALVSMAADMQLIRASMITELGQEYVRAARARGLPRRLVLWKHALRNAILPFITSVGLQLPRLFFAAAFIEFVYGIPGLGQLFLRAVYTPPASGGQLEPRDTSVITAYFLILGVLTVSSSLVADLAYALADPRVRLGGGTLTARTAGRPGRRELHIAGRRVSPRLVALGGVAVASVVVVILALRQPDFSNAQALLNGAWIGTATYGIGSTATIYMNLQVDARGQISGTAGTCQFGSAVPQNYALYGSTDGTTNVSITFHQENQEATLNGALPLSDRSPLNLSGSTNSIGGFLVNTTMTVQFRHGTLDAFTSICQSGQG